MNTCLICYDFQADRGEMVFLDCAHSLCSLCLSKLQQQACPFCRTAIKEIIPKGTDIDIVRLPSQSLRRNYLDEDNYQRTLRIRTRRRRRRRRTTTETMDSDLGLIYVETSIDDAVFRQKKRYKRSKSGKEKRRKAKWGRRNAHVRGSRCITCR